MGRAAHLFAIELMYILGEYCIVHIDAIGDSIHSTLMGFLLVMVSTSMCGISSTWS